MDDATQQAWKNTTISGNRANGNGGGVFIQAATGGTVALIHSTITLNTSDNDRAGGGAGGGVFLARGRAQLDHTIVATNTDNSTIGRDLTGFLGAVFMPRYSLIGSNVGNGLAQTPIGHPDDNGNLIGGAIVINPRLGPLADNGGPTRTHALLPDSPAVNAGDLAARPGLDGVPLTDQRGAPATRVYGGRIDIGAFERQPTEFLLGDFNHSGQVNAADFVLWRKALGQSDGHGFVVDSRGNDDGIVNHWDYALWLANFGSRVSVDAAAVVEHGPMDGAEQLVDAAALVGGVQDRTAVVPPTRGVVESRLGDTWSVAAAHSDALIALLAERDSDDAEDFWREAVASDSAEATREAVDTALATWGRVGHAVEAF